MSSHRPRKVSFGGTMKAVLCAFIGIRKGSTSTDEDTQFNPVHVVLAGLIGVIALIVILISIVQSVIP